MGCWMDPIHLLMVWQFPNSISQSMVCMGVMFKRECRIHSASQRSKRGNVRYQLPKIQISQYLLMYNHIYSSSNHSSENLCKHSHWQLWNLAMASTFLLTNTMSPGRFWALNPISLVAFFSHPTSKQMFNKLIFSILIRKVFMTTKNELSTNVYCHDWHGDKHILLVMAI